MCIVIVWLLLLCKNEALFNTRHVSGNQNQKTHDNSCSQSASVIINIIPKIPLLTLHAQNYTTCNPQLRRDFSYH